MNPIKRVKECPVFENKYGTLFNDYVVNSKGIKGRYLRWQWEKPGVVIVPRHDDLFALCLMYRYSVQARSPEFPRGAVEPDESFESAALRELQEETGLIATSCRIVGEVYADTGLIESKTHVAIADVRLERSGEMRIEQMESISTKILWKSLTEIRASIRDGEIKCALTISALSFLP